MTREKKLKKIPVTFVVSSSEDSFTPPPQVKTAEAAAPQQRKYIDRAVSEALNDAQMHSSLIAAGLRLMDDLQNSSVNLTLPVEMQEKIEFVVCGIVHAHEQLEEKFDELWAALKAAAGEEDPE